MKFFYDNYRYRVLCEDFDRKGVVAVPLNEFQLIKNNDSRP